MIEINKINNRIKDFENKEGINLIYCGQVSGGKSQLNYERIIVENKTTNEKISCTYHDFITYYNYCWKDLVRIYNKRKGETIDKVNNIFKISTLRISTITRIS